MFRSGLSPDDLKSLCHLPRDREQIIHVLLFRGVGGDQADDARLPAVVVEAEALFSSPSIIFAGMRQKRILASGA